MGADGTYDLFSDPGLADWMSKPGNRERIRNLKVVRDTCGGLFHVIWVTARDLNDTPWAIAGRYPEEHLMMKLVALDEATGEFSAALVDPTTILLEQRAMHQRPVQPPVYRVPTAKVLVPVRRRRCWVVHAPPPHRRQRRSAGHPTRCVPAGSTASS